MVKRKSEHRGGPYARVSTLICRECYEQTFHLIRQVAPDRIEA